MEQWHKGEQLGQCFCYLHSPQSIFVSLTGIRICLGAPVLRDISSPCLGFPKYMLLCPAELRHSNVKLHQVTSLWVTLSLRRQVQRRDSRETVYPGRSASCKSPRATAPSWLSQECQLSEAASGSVCIGVVNCTFNENSWILWTIEWAKRK